MNKLEIYDPAMCCSTGVCGPSVDPELTRVASAIFSLQKRGFDIERYNLANEPGKFTENKAVTDFLQEKGPDALPVILLNGDIVMESTYPSNDELSEWFDIDTEELNDRPKNNSVTIDISELK
ncbi:arsenite efflux transporter metallochaperone ArsD [Halobacillus shinanisalinarum]|uniref:Arsenite efflux transporter metallochaperone ArsD n=1 Tax=Halobacillus shinanisalinarum TaxID=2932258 RepID=A0ABY4H1C1_9BACI|nr:arsenite efflux transporter metallochaperone ArsD [Halobacillus shinanisalinarum]UOQ93960.1 arsenite efflux transporter metallochaperone ArsD [Halobacillus shinanisalinarum]